MLKCCIEDCEKSIRRNNRTGACVSHRYLVEEEKIRRREYHQSRVPESFEERWALRIKKRYKLSVEDYTLLVKLQSGLCPICKLELPDPGQGIAIDHDHNCCPSDYTCGNCVRGVLHSECNKLVGFIERLGHSDWSVFDYYLSATKRTAQEEEK